MERHFTISAGVGALLALGAPAVDMPLRAQWRPMRGFGIGVRIDVPLVGSTVTGPEGNASVSAVLVGPEFSATWVETRWLRFQQSAGVAVVELHATGHAEPPYHGESVGGTAGLAFLGVEVAPRLTDAIHLSLAGLAGVAPVDADISFAGQVVAKWAHPLGQASVGVDVDF
jgi:hypothetical protein